MATTTVTVNYRPIKVGFLVKKGDRKGLVDACQMSTLLWGGIYSAIITVDSDLEKTLKQVNCCRVDILCGPKTDPDVESMRYRQMLWMSRRSLVA